MRFRRQKNFYEKEDGSTLLTKQRRNAMRGAVGLKHSQIALTGDTGKSWAKINVPKPAEVMNVLNQHLPKDDQLDWREIYDNDRESE